MAVDVPPVVWGESTSKGNPAERRGIGASCSNGAGFGPGRLRAVAGFDMLDFGGGWRGAAERGEPTFVEPDV